MRRFPSPRALPLAALLVCALAACGSEIGDSCAVASDCSASGDRICDVNSPGGYCTVFGCDFDTCPSEAVCVRFFSVSSSNLSCDPLAEDVSEDNCTADELCTLGESCVPRSAEFRYCMRKCSSNSDCRDDYECRTEDGMKVRGGEPVLQPGQTLEDGLQAFCAPRPATEL